MSQSIVIDGFACPLHLPLSVPELRDLIRRATGANQAVYPVGGGTMLDFGLPPNKPGVAVDLTKLDQVIDYPARDMTITVQAGITMAKLQETLAKEGQRLPIDVPLPERATLGGAIACNMSGPRRYGYGTLRDYVIGITVVNDEGQETKAGGRVVKNVAGYDLCKLHIGALGTLAIVTQVTLKVVPRPEATSLVELPCLSSQLRLLLDRLHTSRTRPAAVTVVSQSATFARNEFGFMPDECLMLVGFEGNSEAVMWQLEALEEEVGQAGVRRKQLWSDDCAEPVWAALADFPLAGDRSVTFKANLLPREIAEFCLLAEPLSPEHLAQAGNGVVIGHLPADTTFEQARHAIDALRARAVEAQGDLVLLRCPTEWKKELGVWGRPRGDWQLMREIKKQLDPNNLFNPGRFIDGI